MKIKYVLGFLFSIDKKNVALIHKTKPDWQNGFINGIGGKIEIIDKFVKDAMVREFKEETGYEFTDWNFVCQLDARGYDVHVFKGFGDLSLVKTTTKEKVEIFNVDDLKSIPILYNLNWLIPMCLDTEYFTASMIYWS